MKYGQLVYCQGVLNALRHSAHSVCAPDGLGTQGFAAGAPPVLDRPLEDETITLDVEGTYNIASDTEIRLVAQAQGNYSGGDGTADSPYQISSIADLQALAAKVNSGESYAGTYFLLTRDIDLSSVYSARSGAS